MKIVQNKIRVWLLFIKSNNFIKNLLKLLGGNAFAQLLPFLISPVLTRIYKPTDFAVYALFLGIVNVLELFSTGMYQRAIMLPINDRDGFKIALLMNKIALSVAILVFIIVIVIIDNLNSLLNLPEKSRLLYLVPLVTYLLGSNNSLTSWNDRKGQFGLASKTRIIMVSLSSVILITLGYLNFGYIAFIISYTMALMFSNLYNRYKIGWYSMIRNYNIKVKELVEIGSEYKRFPIFTLPQRLLLRVFQQIPIFFINSTFSQVQLGYYSFANRVVNSPISEVAMASQRVFYKKMYELSGNTERLQKFTIRIFWYYTAVFTIGLVLFVPFAPSIFSIIFGTEWQVAGTYVQFLAPYYLSVFAVVPLVNLYYIAEKNQFLLIWEISRIILFALFIIIFYIYGKEWDIKYFLIVYSLLYLISQMFLAFPLVNKNSSLWNTIKKINLNEGNPHY